MAVDSIGRRRGVVKGIGRWTLATFAVLAAAAVGAGCGSGGDQGSTAAETVAPIKVDPSMTKAKYRRQANVICVKGKTKQVYASYHAIKQRGLRLASELPPSLQSKLLAVTMRKDLDQIRQIGVPPKDKKEIEAFVQAFQNALVVVEEGKVHMEELEPVLLTIYRPAIAYGLTGCAYGH